MTNPKKPPHNTPSMGKDKPKVESTPSSPNEPYQYSEGVKTDVELVSDKKPHSPEAEVNIIEPASASLKFSGGTPKVTMTGTSSLEAEGTIVEPHSDSTLDGKMSISKEASENEKCLSIDEYSNILQEVFTSSPHNDDFCFALFGAWGRGKTFLANSVSKLLKKRDHYLIVNFNAWKYKKTPDVWVYLYESFCESITNSNFFNFQKLIVALRAGIIKNKYLPLVYIVCAIIFASISITQKLHWSIVIISYLGSLIVPVMASFYFIYSTRHNLKKLSNLYGNIPSHREKLGIQEVIGNDLKHLVISMVPKNWFKTKIKPTTEKRIIQVASAIFIIVPLVLISLTNLKAVAISLLIYLMVMLFSITFSDRYKHKKILLVIDDLDRCDYTHMLDIIESIKLMLNDKEIMSRVQVLFLIEESKLLFSIEKRFEEYIEYKTNINTSFDKNTVVKGHLEKLMTAHMRLGEISHEDRKIYINKVINHNPLAKNDKELSKQDGTHISSKSITTEADTNYIYCKEEIDFINSFSIEMENWSPRQIRIFLIKYQLARSIARELKLDINNIVIAQSLKIAITNGKDLTKDDARASSFSLDVLKAVNPVY